MSANDAFGYLDPEDGKVKQVRESTAANGEVIVTYQRLTFQELGYEEQILYCLFLISTFFFSVQ